jgi:hypothetical protein
MRFTYTVLSSLFLVTSSSLPRHIEGDGRIEWWTTEGTTPFEEFTPFSQTTTTTSPVPSSNDWLSEHDIRLAEYLRGQAERPTSNPTQDVGQDPFCEEHHQAITNLIPRVYSFIQLRSQDQRIHECRRLNIASFFRAVCPKYWSSRTPEIQKVAVEQAFLCSSTPGYTQISVDRSRVVDTSIVLLGDESADYRNQVNIAVQGVSGVPPYSHTKDWISRFATLYMINNNYLFVLDAENQLKFAPLVVNNRHHADRLKMVGKFLGIIARKDRNNAPISLPLVYYSKIVDKPLTWSSLSPDDIEFSKYDEVMRTESNNSDDKILGEIWTVDNRQELVERAINHLGASDMTKIGHLKSGLEDVLSKEVISLLSPQDLRGLIEGYRSIDPTDLLEHKWVHKSAVAKEEYNDNLEWFKRFVQGLNREGLKKLNRFVTGVAYPPLGGFAKLSPWFHIKFHQSDSSKLPTSDPWRNTINIPIYASEEDFVEKLSSALETGATVSVV